MSILTLSEVSKIIDAKFSEQDKTFEFVSTDTRTINNGDLFIALRGPNYDGHNFIDDAASKGAIAAIVDRPIPSPCLIPTLQVSDTLIALGKLAKWRRDKYAVPIIAVTGSCGKTTTKSLLTSILEQKGKVLSPQKSFNNAIGLPLTLMQLTKEHEYAITEIGANHFGEIAYLTNIASPNVAIITTIAPVHLEGFGDLNGVAKAKSEIFQGLPRNGIAVINADDHFCNYLKERAAPHRIITFSKEVNADVFAKNVKLTNEGFSKFVLHIGNESIDITLPLLGSHHVTNALAAAAGTFAIGASLTEIKKGLENIIPVDKRMVKKPGIDGSIILDDTYNANPVAVEAALRLVNKFNGEKVFIFGEMGELGKEAAYCCMSLW